MHAGMYESRFRSWSWNQYRPSQLLFTHDSIKTDFQDGHSMEETLKSFLTGNVVAANIQPMVVMQYRGRPYVVYGNRRLFLYQKLEKHGYLNEVKVKEVAFDKDIFEKMCSTTTDGRSVRLRGYHGYRMDSDLDEVIRCHGLPAAGPVRFKNVVLQSAGMENFIDRSPEPNTGLGDICGAIAKLVFGLILLCLIVSAFTKKG